MLFRLGGGPEDAQEIMAHEFFNNIDWEKLYRKEIMPPFKPNVQTDTDTCYFDKVIRSCKCCCTLSGNFFSFSFLLSCVRIISLLFTDIHFTPREALYLF